jgi:hypothetical protein
MVGNALLATCVVLLAAAFALLGECRCLIPYRLYIIREYGTVLVAFTAVLALNLFGGFYLASRALFLKDTGRKLAHIEKQIRRGRSIVADLADRLEE